MSASYSRSSMKSKQPPPSARHARPRAPEPSEPHGSALQERICSSSCLSWLHLLKSWSLRQSRGGSHWSLCSMAAAAGISYSSVQRIWRAHGLKPHVVGTFKVSRDKNFAAQVEDVVGLYLDPPDRALVFCVESQIQALDRTQPGLPMKKGRAGTVTHDYKRNGTTTLFAALNMLDGKVIGSCMPRHRHREFLRF